MTAPRGLVIAGAASGVGKTTVTLGLLEALRRRGLVVQPFKVGPDFIDAGFHALVAGRPSYNLDGWMCGREHVRATVARAAREADLALVEGVMGCFDGLEPSGEEGSTAEVAKWLGAPVVLVVDVAAQSGSASAVVLGFERFDPALRVAGVIANGAGGERHGRGVLDAIAACCRAVPLGAIARDARLTLPERHLGLVTAGEGPLDAERRARLAAAVEQAVDLDRLLDLAAPLTVDAPEIALGASRPRVTIAVARDVAFQFYYAENLERLRAAGARLVAWSPLTDTALPPADGLYLGGGYPELHARALGDNARMREAVREFVESGRPVYAECGGLMYLADALEDAGGEIHPMVGALPTTVRMRPGRLALGYTAVRFAAPLALGPAGTTARGHEFHCSTLDPVPASVPRAWQVEGRPEADGYLCGGALASYVHLHFGSNPELAPALVRACERAR